MLEGSTVGTWSQLLSKQGHLRAHCTVLQQTGLDSLSAVGHTLQLLLWMKSAAATFILKWDSACRETALCVLNFWVHNLGTLLFPPFDYYGVNGHK